MTGFNLENLTGLTKPTLSLVLRNTEKAKIVATEPRPMPGTSARKAAKINRTREDNCQTTEDNCRTAEGNCRKVAGNFRMAAEVCRAGICPPDFGNTPPHAVFSLPPAANGDLSPILLQR